MTDTRTIEELRSHFTRTAGDADLDPRMVGIAQRRATSIRRRRNAAVAASVAVVAVCGATAMPPFWGSDVESTPATAAAKPFPLFVEESPRGFVYQALRSGILAADEDCVWLESKYGYGGNLRIDLMWPAGWSARLVNGSVEVVDPEGQVAAKEGQEISLGGGFESTGPRKGCLGQDRVFVIGDATGA